MSRFSSYEVVTITCPSVDAEATTLLERGSNLTQTTAESWSGLDSSVYEVAIQSPTWALYVPTNTWPEAAPTQNLSPL